MSNMSLAKYSIIFSIVIIQNCVIKTKSNNKFHILRKNQTRSIIAYSSQVLRQEMAINLNDAKKRIRLSNNTLKLDDLSRLEEIIRLSDTPNDQLSKEIIALSKSNRQDYIGVVQTGKLVKQLNEYAFSLKKSFFPYLTDTTSWSRRYIKRLPPEQQKNPPSFAEFYFKGASQEEALVVLSTLQLGILQEALEIQEKILKE